MFKLIGAIVVGLLSMAAAAFFAFRSKEQRTTDFESGKKLFSQLITSLKDYASKLMNPEKPTEGAV